MTYISTSIFNQFMNNIVDEIITCLCSQINWYQLLHIHYLIYFLIIKLKSNFNYYIYIKSN